MGFKEMMTKAVNMGSVAKFQVIILPKEYNGEEQESEMSYIQLGTYLVTNEQNIESVIINLKEE